MRKFVYAVCVLAVVLGLVVLFCVGCFAVNKTDAESERIFEYVSDEGRFRIAYDKETKVMYAVSDSGHAHGVVTPLFDADGSPKLYKGV